MLPIIQAEETLTQITVGAVGGGNLKEAESKKIMKQLTKQAGARETKRMLTIGEAIACVSSMGIPVIDMRKKKKLP